MVRPWVTLSRIIFLSGKHKGASKNSEFAQMQGAGKILQRRI